MTTTSPTVNVVSESTWLFQMLWWSYFLKIQMGSSLADRTDRSAELYTMTSSAFVFKITWYGMLLSWKHDFQQVSFGKVWGDLQWFLLAEISVRSPRKLINYIIERKKNLDRSVQIKYLLHFENRSTGDLTDASAKQTSKTLMISAGATEHSPALFRNEQHICELCWSWKYMFLS